MNLNELLDVLMKDMRQVADTASIIGEPLKLGKNHMVPLLGVTIGFGSGATDMNGATERRGGRAEGGGAGGTLVLEPRAFVVVDAEGIPQLIAMRGKKGVVTEAIALSAATATEAPATKAAEEPQLPAAPAKKT